MRDPRSFLVTILALASLAGVARAQDDTCSEWTPGLFPEVSVDGTGHALASFDDGSGPTLVAGGAFAMSGGSPALGVARWDGTTWSAFGAGLLGTVGALAVVDTGSGPRLYARSRCRAA